ncbi:hypothetical protein FRC06_002480 [Ceratobasidium sp. 370]|nr:hypothetical protein FRC06_002480 [Ceratobasidium sp. 370]
MADSASSLAKVPSMSDVNAVLAWVAKLAKQATLADPANQSDSPLHLLARVLGDTHSHRIASLPARTMRAQHHLSYPRHTDLVEDNAEVLEAEAALALGHHLCLQNKPTLADFPGLPRRVTSIAIPELLAEACTEGPFKVFGTMDKWANASYCTVWDREVPDTPFMRLPRQLRALDPANDEDPYEHPGLCKCIAAAFFWGPDALRMAHHEKFRPIPLPTIAMVLTIIQQCIQEWGTRRHVQTELKADLQLKMYRAHLQGLLAYNKKAPTQLNEFCDEWFWYGV